MSAFLFPSPTAHFAAPHTSPRSARFPPSFRGCLSSSPHTRADFGGISLNELNSLELQFLVAIDFRLAVAPGDLARAAASLRAAPPAPI